MDYLVVPDFVEHKGSLYLRSDHMDYSRCTLNSNWHQAREAEPKTYDINDFPAPPGRNLHATTYNRFGDPRYDTLPKTTTQEHLEQIKLKDAYTEKEVTKKMLDAGSFANCGISRETPFAPSRGFGAVLPRHHPDHDKMHLETTHVADYCVPYPYTPMSPPEEVDNSAAFRRQISQFTDIDDYRRLGKNTWHDESGIYANAAEKAKLFPQSNPIPLRLTEGLL